MASLMPGLRGAALVCPSLNSTVRITLSTAYNWYTGASTPNPSPQVDVQAIVTHELGHAHQAWTHCTDGDADDKDPCHGNHYDPTYNGAICDLSTPANYSTMCYLVLSGTNNWRWRNLETHDVDLVESMY
jgi:hypothetical protein